MGNDSDGQSLRALLQRSIQRADDAERLSLAASHTAELLEQRMDHFEKMDAERRTITAATLARIEEGVAGLYTRGWNFALVILGGLLGSAGIIAAVAFTVGKVGGIK